MMKQSSLFSTFFLLIQFVSAQRVVISVDGKNAPMADTIKLESLGPAFARTKGEAGKIVNVSLPVYPEKVNTYSISVCQPNLYFIGGGGKILLAENDSINVSYDLRLKGYAITGGRYPDNYGLYTKFEAAQPESRYKIGKDNYLQYARYLDSFSLSREAALDAEKAKGVISVDAYEFIKAYIKYTHLKALLITNSVTLGKMLPKTASVFVPNISAKDFSNDACLSMFPYQFSIELYQHILSQRQGLSKNEIGFQSTLSRELYSNILFDLDSLVGETRQEELFSQIVNNDWRNETLDKHLFQPLFDRIRKLKLSQNDSRIIADQYEKSLLNGEMLDTALMANTFLLTRDNKRQSLLSVLTENKSKKVMIDLWWTADEENVLLTDKERNKTYPNDEYIIVHIAVNRRTTAERWKRQLSNKGITGFQYYLDDHFNSPLLSYFHISKLPQYISIDQTGKIENSDVPFYFFMPVSSDIKDSAAK